MALVRGEVDDTIGDVEVVGDGLQPGAGQQGAVADDRSRMLIAGDLLDGGECSAVQDQAVEAARAPVDPARDAPA